ncbi:MAG: hypothetical protein Q9M29_09215, partial [Mariprofundaceae bacterium]|nr:hypothetical protein [Mariprofundaceae bacterium]
MTSGADRQHVLQLVISDDYHGQRLDHALAALSGLSRSRIQQLLKNGCVHGAEASLKASGR